jgi:hypothetical protein
MQCDPGSWRQSGRQRVACPKCEAKIKIPAAPAIAAIGSNRSNPVIQGYFSQKNPA